MFIKYSIINTLNTKNAVQCWHLAVSTMSMLITIEE